MRATYRGDEINFNQKREDKQRDLYKIKERKEDGDTSMLDAVIKETGERIYISLRDVEFTKR